MSAWTDISEVAEVFAFLEEGDELGFVDDFLTSGIHEDTLLWHEAHEFATDRALSLRRSGDMEGDDVAGREELLLAGDSVYTFLLDDFGRREGVVSIDIHAEALSDASYVAARVTVSQEAKLLILELSTRGAIEAVTYAEEEHSEDELSYSVSVLSRSVHHAYAVSGSGLEVYVIVASTSADDDLELLSSVEDLGIYDVATDDDCFDVGDSCEELGLSRILFEEDYFEASFGEDLLDTSYCGSSEGFFGGNKNL